MPLHNLTFRSSAKGAAKIPFKNSWLRLREPDLRPESSVQFTFNSSDARLKVKGSSRESGIRSLPHRRSSKINKIARENG
jgi:hypothetical protein